MNSGTFDVNQVPMKAIAGFDPSALKGDRIAVTVIRVKAGCSLCRCSVADLDRHIYEEHSDKQDEKTGNFASLKMTMPDLETQELKAYKVDRVSVLKGKN